MILAGGIGGTNARFGCLEPKPEGGWAVQNYAKVKGSDFASFDDAIKSYLSQLETRPTRAAFAAAGPVESGYINLTNTDWQISPERVAITVAEVTLRTPAALEAIKKMKQAVPSLIVGAGTILTKDDLENAINAGSDFIVTPATDKTLRKALQKSDIPVFPGVATPSEALSLYRHGFKYLKFFPAESNGGVKALKSMASPLPDITFMPTGGITGDTVKDYLACPNVIAVGSSWMVDNTALKIADWKNVERTARRAVDAI